MKAFRRSAQKVVAHPVAFFVQVFKAFRANQGLLLAGGVAYYTLLSIVPLLILLVIVLSHVIAADELLATLARYLELVAPGPERPDHGGHAHLHRQPRRDRLDARDHAACSSARSRSRCSRTRCR